MLQLLALAALAADLPPPEILEATEATPIRREADASAVRRGTLGKGEAFEVLERVTGPGCDSWGRLPGQGYACLDRAMATARVPEAQPRLVDFVHPSPAEYETYKATGTYDRAAAVDPLLPYIYGKRWRTWEAPTYASAEAYARGDAPVAKLDRDRKFHFVGVVPTARGDVFLRENGAVVPVDEVFLYPVDRFGGWRTEEAPIPDGMMPAWAVGYDGIALRAAPSLEGVVGRTLPFHEAVLVRPAATGWWQVPDAIAPGTHGYVAEADVAHPIALAPPAGIGPNDVWVDVELSEQTLTLYRGTEPLLITPISSGKPGDGTPTGLYRLSDKHVHGDMRSRPGADEPYYVEDVPWVMHFRPRYAIHGVFWHWGFGRVASHGCVNLAPRDARYVFDHVGPTLEPGWHDVIETVDDPGSLVRVRWRTTEPKDRREPLE